MKGRLFAIGIAVAAIMSLFFLGSIIEVVDAFQYFLDVGQTQPPIVWWHICLNLL